MIALAALALAVAPWEAPQQRVDIGGRRINLYCTGSGGPTVILEAGFAATMWTWGKAQARLASTNRVCSYDRAGAGFSDPGQYPRDADAIVGDLAAVLKAAGIAPPYVLAAHSAGGLTMRLFAVRHPGEVVGMVLVDPVVEDEFGPEESAAVAARVAADTRCADAAAAHALPSLDPALTRCTAPLPARLSPAMADQLGKAQLDPDHWRTLASEYASMAGANIAQVRASAASHGDLPLVVLTSGDSAAQDPHWETWHQQLAARSTRGRQQTLPGPHNLVAAQQDAVVAAILEVAKAGVEPPRAPR